MVKEVRRKKRSRWRPPAFTGLLLFELLESEGFEVFLVEPGQFSALRGAAQDRRARLPVDPAAAQLRAVAGVVPASEFRVLARYVPTRGSGRCRVRYAASHVHNMQKALEQMNVKLTEVVSDIAGLTGLSIIDAAILKVQRDPIKLAQPAIMGAVITARRRLPLRCKERGGPSMPLRAAAGRRVTVLVPSWADHRVRPAD